MRTLSLGWAFLWIFFPQKWREILLWRHGDSRGFLSLIEVGNTPLWRHSSQGVNMDVQVWQGKLLLKSNAGHGKCKEGWTIKIVFLYSWPLNKSICEVFSPEKPLVWKIGLCPRHTFEGMYINISFSDVKATPLTHTLDCLPCPFILRFHFIFFLEKTLSFWDLDKL